MKISKTTRIIQEFIVKLAKDGFENELFEDNVLKDNFGTVELEVALAETVIQFQEFLQTTKEILNRG